ncbi:MAG: bifunctional folylpolyglutamate synthase/dihydrofolate synthase [Sphingobacteriaceae bacterium]
MNYTQTLDYLYQQLPMFTRVGASAFREDLTNTVSICELLGNPQHQFKSIHVAGTNGKGSTSHMLAAILQIAGYKTGLYTSPHLRDFRERIRINGEMIAEQKVVDFVSIRLKDFEIIKPSFFEMSVGLAFDFFAREKVDISVIEVGVGGRLDSTNIISPLLSVITNIGWDHMNILGNTLQQIAKEKAGIIKPLVPVVIGEFQEEIASIFEKKASDKNSSICFASKEWEITTVGKPDFINHPNANTEVSVRNLSSLKSRSLKLDLTGAYQLKNLKTVLSSVEELRKQNFVITDEHIAIALKQVKSLTGLAGRWETLSHHPLVICDTGHNPEGIREVLLNISLTPHKNLHFIIGMVNDKDLGKILTLLPKNALYYFCKPNIPRGLDASSLANEAAMWNLTGHVYSSVQQALMAAKTEADEDDLIFIGGSTFVVAEVV